MGLFNLGRKRPAKALKLIAKYPSQMTLEEWRSSPDMVRTARRFLEDPDFRTMVEVMRNSSFGNWSMAMGTSMDERAFMQCRCEGYSAALNNLESMGKLSVGIDEPEPTFEEPEPLSPNQQ